MIDILLIHPGATHGIYGALGDKLTSVEPPLWPRLIAGYLLDRGWKVEILDQECEGISAEEVAQRVRKIFPRIVAICVFGHQPSASTQQMTGSRAIAQAINDIGWETFDSAPPMRTKPIVVMLGNHPSALPERTLREEPVDYVIDGEGPVTLDAMLKLATFTGGNTDDTLTLDKIPGLVWWGYGGSQKRETVYCNPPAPLFDVDRDLHGNAWHLLPPPSRYRAHAWQCLSDQATRTPYAAVYTSLGCPYTCGFCMINTFQHTNKYRMRSPEKVVAEMSWLAHEHGVRTFKIIDELFILNRAHYTAIANGLIELQENHIGPINVWAYSRTDAPHLREDLPLLRAAGVQWLALGIESGSGEVRDLARKKLRADDDTNQAIHAVVRDIRSAGISVIGNYIFGLVGDTQESMLQTLELALELNTEFANFYCAHAYPGSALYDEVARDRPQDLPPSWAAYSQHNRHTYPLRTEALSPAQILAFRDAAFKEYFTSPRWREMVHAKFGPAAIAHVDEMLQYELVRDLLEESAHDAQVLPEFAGGDRHRRPPRR
jgi:anaerobic magnesium-protoporphyrin IX monomethyl ester cyclase